MITTPSGLQYEDSTVGSGAVAKAGQRVAVHYTGWLYQDGQQGAKFDSSKDRGQPFVFPLGAGHVIKGWDEGVQGMAVGEVANRNEEHYTPVTGAGEYASLSPGLNLD